MEQVGYHGVSSNALDGSKIGIFGQHSVYFAAGRRNFQTIVENEYRDFSASYFVPSVDQCIDECLFNRAHDVARRLDAIVVGFCPCNAVVPINEVHSLAQQLYEAAGVLLIVENLAVDLCLVKPIPARAEHAILAQYGLVGEENSCIGKEAVGLGKAE